VIRAAGALALVFASAACGSSGGTEQLSASEYRTKADAICEKANQDLGAIAQPKSPGELDDFVDKAKPVLKNAIDDLEALRPPAELRPAVNRWNAENEKALHGLDELKGAKLTEIQAKAAEFAQINEDANAIARNELGLKACAAG
jgi:hypothetical protein